jgi:outer membrane protein assembly factor BamE (lipoprotein component of BamABCDE complex)
MKNFIILFLISGCALFTTSESVNDNEKELTPGIIKKELKAGLSSAEVVQILGSPNIITKDSKGKEVWVYDRISAEVETRSDAVYGTILILGFVSQKTKTVKTQKTLTVIITFDNDKVESFSYHYSKF